MVAAISSSLKKRVAFNLPIEGNLVSAEGGAPITDAGLTLHIDSDLSHTNKTRSDAHGCFTFTAHLDSRLLAMLAYSPISDQYSLSIKSQNATKFIDAQTLRNAVASIKKKLKKKLSVPGRSIPGLSAHEAFVRVGSMKLRAWQCLIVFLSSVGLLTILVGLTLLLRMESSTEPKLFAHPNALWVGAEDGGVFVEITKHEAPDYYVEIRHENGGMRTEGRVRCGTRDSHPLSAAAIGGYGGEELYVYTGVTITPQKQGVVLR